MACLLTSGYDFQTDCKTGGAGGYEVLLTEFRNLVTAPTYTSNVITAMALATGKQFRRYQLDNEMISYSSPGSYNEQAGSWTYEHKIDFTIKGWTTLLAAEIKLIGLNKLIMITKNVNGVYRVFGLERGMDLMTGADDNEAPLKGFQGFKLSFKGQGTSYAPEINSALISTLLSPAA